mmetsp:Transcript_4660/g.11374  ORF Transcript_4660/g.11374 Transcript_4660/m.11374 type:complete len:206 (-) Transcript_4660:740-1357(-)
MQGAGTHILILPSKNRFASLSILARGLAFPRMSICAALAHVGLGYTTSPASTKLSMRRLRKTSRGHLMRKARENVRRSYQYLQKLRPGSLPPRALRQSRSRIKCPASAKNGRRASTKIAPSRTTSTCLETFASARGSFHGSQSTTAWPSAARRPMCHHAPMPACLVAGAGVVKPRPRQHPIRAAWARSAKWTSKMSLTSRVCRTL